MDSGSTKATKPGFFTLDAVDPTDGSYSEVFLSLERARLLAVIGDWRLEEMKHLLPFVLTHPTAIFEWKREGEVRGLCYVASPKSRYVGVSASEVPAQKNRVFTVFVTDKSIIETWRWEAASQDDPPLPLDQAPERFARKLL